MQQDQVMTQPELKGLIGLMGVGGGFSLTITLHPTHTFVNYFVAFTWVVGP